MWNPLNPLSEQLGAPAPAGGRAGDPHEHSDCPPQERPWLESRIGESATMRPHTFCVSCGKVRTLNEPTARSLGFYLSGLSALKEHLERSAHRFKMTQAQSRLISKDLEQLGEFEDTYGLALGAQVHLYLEAVRRVRPDLEGELVLRLLPKLKSASRKPLIDLMALTPADAVQPRH